MGSTTKVKRIVISGYYGFDNSGDEAVLLSILLALEEQGKANGIQFEPVVLSVDPEKTKRTYGVEAVHRMKLGQVIAAVRGADGLISGGGSLLQDATSAKTIPYYLAIVKIAQWLGKPTFVYSQGIGPVKRGIFFGWIRAVFKKCKFVSVRDQESKQLLQTMNINGEIMVVPDPVMGLPLGSSTGVGASDSSVAGMDSVLEGEKKPVIGVSVRYWNSDRSELKAIAEALRLIMEQSDAEVRFLPFHLPSDKEASDEVRALVGGAYQERLILADDVTHPQHMLAEVSRCDLLIGMRLHSLIYAASQEIPMLGISYDPKIDQFLNRLHMTAVASTDSIQASTVASEAIHLMQNRAVWQAEKRPIIEKLKNEAQKPAQHIALFFTKGRDAL